MDFEENKHETSIYIVSLSLKQEISYISK